METECSDNDFSRQRLHDHLMSMHFGSAKNLSNKATEYSLRAHHRSAHDRGVMKRTHALTNLSQHGYSGQPQDQASEFNPEVARDRMRYHLIDYHGVNDTAAITAYSLDAMRKFHGYEHAHERMTKPHSSDEVILRGESFLPRGHHKDECTKHKIYGTDSSIETEKAGEEMPYIKPDYETVRKGIAAAIEDVLNSTEGITVVYSGEGASHVTPFNELIGWVQDEDITGSPVAFKVAVEASRNVDDQASAAMAEEEARREKNKAIDDFKTVNQEQE